MWLIDDLRRQFDTALLAAVIHGAADENIPIWSKWRERFDIELHSPPPEADDSDQSVLLRSLGVGDR